MHEPGQQNSSTICKSKLGFSIGFRLLIFSPCTNTVGAVQTEDFDKYHCEVLTGEGLHVKFSIRLILHVMGTSLLT